MKKNQEMLLKRTQRLLVDHRALNNLVRQYKPQTQLQNVQISAHRHFQHDSGSLHAGLSVIDGSLRDSEAYERYVFY